MERLLKDLKSIQRIHRKYRLKCFDLQKIPPSWHCPFKADKKILKAKFDRLPVRPEELPSPCCWQYARHSRGPPSQWSQASPTCSSSWRYRTAASTRSARTPLHRADSTRTVRKIIRMAFRVWYGKPLAGKNDADSKHPSLDVVQPWKSWTGLLLASCFTSYCEYIYVNILLDCLIWLRQTLCNIPVP